ncbi:hypothetical protein DYB34_005859 [Aphanomyces astaci]|uniref:Uncharacterized protein n=1 Tax=Aphanomyces astaci TaxID=112090 RepID=A0A418BC36_APHAT|nr:hypothetical protein DYB34_005859 [Aphanomyces astaci]
MAYAVSDELAQVKAQLDMERAQWVQHGRANTSAVSEAQWFELKSTLALVEADKNVAQQVNSPSSIHIYIYIIHTTITPISSCQDADRLHSELLNLHAVLTQFQSRRETEVGLSYTMWMLDLMDEEQEAQWQAKEASWTSRLAALEADVASSRERQTSTDDVALLKQSVAKKDGEIERLRDGFTPEENERMRAHPGRLKSIPLLGSIFGSSDVAPPPQDQVHVAGTTFSDAWADFLLRETK